METQKPEEIPTEATATEPRSQYTLRGRMGTFGLLTTVLAFTAPLGIVFGFIPVNISFGISVPIMFLGVALLVALFAAGFTAMTKAIPRPGAFYTYICEGLGRPMGLGSSFLAIGTYGVNTISCIVVAGISANNLISAFVGDATVPWWVWSLAFLVISSVLSYFNIELSAKILSVILVIEVTIVAIFDFVMIANGGPEGNTFEPWNPANIITPSVGILLLFTIGVFNGFEATAIYRDEVRNPSKTIPRATFLTVGFLGVFYAISGYALILSTGTSQAVATAKADPTGIMPAAITQYFGVFANQLVSILIITSFFASLLSLQNIITRYAHSLSVDGIFPKRLARVHEVHGSPYRSAMAVSLALLVALIILIVSQGDPNALYAGAAGVAFYGIILLLFLTGIAVIVYFRRNRTTTFSVWRTLVAPIISILAIGTALLLATFNMEYLVAGDPLLLNALLLVSYILLGSGVITALVLRKKGSPLYRRIGRAVE